MKIADVMTKDVTTCSANDSLNRAAQLMWERRCGYLPVLNEGGRVVGIVTDRDACMAAYTQGRRLDDITVTTAMSRPVWTCAPSATVDEAEDLMMAHGIRRLVVVEEGLVQGVVSLDDIARNGAEWDGKGEIDLERLALALGEIARRTSAAEEEGPASEDADADIGELAKNSLAALRTLREEIRVDLELATKEARDRWRRFETRLQAAEVRAVQTGRDGARTLAGLIENARTFRKRLRGKTTPTARAG